ncbi:hypothetical protein K933_10360 [Candidatus Halobonum tyrrellensis G22]|uniref:Uncharacterized protein n=2 Tax=Candidatus Halobonum TaxID=1431544 RepID=V4GSX6_9EURY|nr:hypothetical protein K933_10360 [Candidatus Halobonum tyrrellensis G22]
MLAVFVVGFAASVWRDDPAVGPELLVPTINGLFAVVLFQFTVGNVWGYAVEYRNAGGRWSDLPFLAPFVAAAAWGLFAFVVTESPGAAAWSAFWGFVVVAAVTALVVQLLLGYRESESESSQPTR